LSPFYSNRLNEFLRAACQQGQIMWVQLLLQKGADVNAPDSIDHLTALDRAISLGRERIVELLLPKATKSTIGTALKRVQNRKELSDIFLKVLQFQEQRKEVSVSDQPPPNDESQESSQPSNESQESIQPSHELEERIISLQSENERIKAEFEELKKEKIELLAQNQKLSSELNKETEARKDLQSKVQALEGELTVRNQEISSVKIERDTERRAKENAKRILSLDGVNLPNITSSATVTESNLSPSNKSRLTKTSSTLNISMHMDTASTANGSTMPAPNTGILARTRDDLESVMENQIKSRVRKLVRRWEDMKALP